jgi:hypothetical protein
METPYTRAIAKDNSDALDNLLSTFEGRDRAEILDYVTSTFKDIERVLERATQDGIEPLVAYRVFVNKVSAHLSPSQ